MRGRLHYTASLPTNTPRHHARTILASAICIQLTEDGTSYDNFECPLLYTGAEQFYRLEALPEFSRARGLDTSTFANTAITLGDCTVKYCAAVFSLNKCGRQQRSVLTSAKTRGGAKRQ